MALTTEEAKEIVEDVFDFDHVGGAMSVLRANLDSQSAQDSLVEELIQNASEESEDSSSDALEMLRSAARERVAQFVKGSKYSQSGCSKV